MNFQTKLKHARILKDYSKSEMAKLIGVSTPTYTAYENGTSEPKLKTLIEIIKVLDIDANYLLKDNNCVLKEEYNILAYVTE